MQYTFDIPETPEAKFLLNLIIASGYFNEVKKNDIEYDTKISKEEFLNDFKTSIQQAKNGETEPLRNLIND